MFNKPGQIDWECLEQLSEIAYGKHTLPPWWSAHPDLQREVRVMVARLWEAGYLDH